MKAGSTFIVVINSDIEAEKIEKVEKIIFTLKGAETIVKNYPDEVNFSDGSFFIPLKQEETLALAKEDGVTNGRKVFIEGQFNFIDKSVLKSEIKSFFISSTLATEIVEGNTPTQYDIADIKFTIDGDIIVAQVDVEGLDEKIEAEVKKYVGDIEKTLSDLDKKVESKVEKVEGKSLIADEEIERLSKVDNYNDTEVKEAIESLDNSKVDKAPGKSLVEDTEIARLKDVHNYDDAQVKKDITDLKNDKVDKRNGYSLVSDAEKQKWDNKSDFSGDYNDLENKPDPSSFGTKVEANPSVTEESPVLGSLKVGETSYRVPQGGSGGGDVTSVNGKVGVVVLNAKDVKALPDDTELFSGDYNDLENKPSIPAELKDLNEDADHKTVSDSEKESWNNKVTKEAGKSLISDTEITRLASVHNYDDSVLSGKVSALEKAGYVTRAVYDLENYYNKSETYTQEEVNRLVSAIPKFAIRVVSSLPTTEISETTIYLLKTSTTETGNLYTEYIYTEGAWEKLGTQTIDLTDYVTISAMNTELNKKVSKVSGKGLSTNDFTNAYKQTIDNLPTSYAPVDAQENVIETVKVNGVSQTVTNKAIDITVPTSANDIGAIPNDVTHLSGDVPITRKVNGKALSSDITLSASDVSALPSTTKIPTVTNTYSSTSTNAMSGKAVASAISGKADASSIPTESTVSEWGFTKNTGTYSKPSAGIPASDLASGVIPTTLPASDVKAWAKAENKPTYTASEVGALASTVNHLSGDVPITRKVNNKALSADITLTASDVGALASTVKVPTKLSDLTADSTHRLVTDAEKSTWNGKANLEIVKNAQGRNKMPFPYKIGMKYVDSGLTFDVDNNGVIKVTGTVNNYTTFEFVQKRGEYELLPGTYTITGGISNDIYIRVQNVTTATDVTLATDTGNGATFTLTEKSKIYIYLQIKNNITVNETIYPMLELGSVSHGFEPPAESNMALKNELDHIFSDAWTQRTYQAGEYAIDGNRLWKCLVTNSERPSEGANWHSVKIMDEINSGLTALNSKLTKHYDLIPLSNGQNLQALREGDVVTIIYNNNTSSKVSKATGQLPTKYIANNIVSVSYTNADIYQAVTGAFEINAEAWANLILTYIIK